MFEEAENKKEKVSIAFEDFIKACSDVHLGSGEEETEQKALETITKRLGNTGYLPLLPDDFDVIPSVDGFLVIESTNELYNIM